MLKEVQHDFESHFKPDMRVVVSISQMLKQVQHDSVSHFMLELTVAGVGI